MSTAAVNIKLPGAPYSPFRRYRVNAVVTYQGRTFQNVTGFNETPSLNGTTWLLISGTPGPTVITINGNPFTLVKNPANSSDDVELNDMAVNGFKDSATFWPIAYYTGGGVDSNDPESWLSINEIEQLPQN